MIRYLNEFEKMNISPLYEETFQDDYDYCQFFYNTVIPQADIIADIDSLKKIQSMITLIPKEINVGRTRCDCYYLYGVATEKKLRGQGKMSVLLKTLMENLYNEEQAFTYLIPDSDLNRNYYRKFGFETVMDKYENKQKEKIKRPSHSFMQRKAENSDAVRLSIFAQNSLSKKYGIFVVHSKEYFMRLIELMKTEKGYVEIILKDKLILGYRVIVDGKIIEEITDDKIKQFEMTGYKSKPYAMARVINAKKMIGMVNTNDAGSVVLKLNDDIIADNNGVFIWNYKPGKMTWEKTDKDPDVEMSIGEFSQYSLGYRHFDGLPALNTMAGFYINDYI
ncbi:MAG: GNAT family N-acetyltransferase [Pseudobutyrivibrio sp.]|nr:GNAT family N-acetyltransferase [Pseudobutyrivibrio sp.]